LTANSWFENVRGRILKVYLKYPMADEALNASEAFIEMQLPWKGRRIALSKLHWAGY